MNSARANACAAVPPPGTDLPVDDPVAKPFVPALNFAPELLLKAQGIRVVFFDVDGVLTDGSLYFSEAGETIKRFHTLDGHGLKLLMRAGIIPVVITGRDSKPLRLRLAALGIEHVHYGTENKYPAAQQTLKALGCDWKQAAAMGDDWPDLVLLRSCVLACAPPNAHQEVKAVSHYVTSSRGGEGAVREVCDLLMVASGQYASLLAETRS